MVREFLLDDDECLVIWLPGFQKCTRKSGTRYIIYSLATVILAASVCTTYMRRATQLGRIKGSQLPNVAITVAPLSRVHIPMLTPQTLVAYKGAIIEEE